MFDLYTDKTVDSYNVKKLLAASRLSLIVYVFLLTLDSHHS